MPQLAAAAAQTVGPDIGGGAHPNPVGAKCLGIQKYDVAGELVSLMSFCVDNFHTAGTLFVFVVKHLCDDGKRAHSQVAGRHSGGQSRGLGAEVSPERTAEAAFVSVHTACAVLLRQGDGVVRDAANDQVPVAFKGFFNPSRHVFSTQFSSNGGRRLPSGSTSKPSRLPLTPANGST